jgi:tetratricopeptide (TPR) repeat protein
MDLSQLPNPYDFANPINDPQLFAGRADEMREIEYYLDHASKAERPINLAILGERASGKTSVLNMVHVRAEARGMMVVRVDLDEADARTELAFFLKVFDSLLTTTCSLGAYGGVAGKTYDCYRDMVDAYEIPSEKEWCPFIFPIQVAKALASGNTATSVSDTSLKRDIANIREEVQRPIALLFDECDVLANSRIHLEKLRNVFMNTPGFMLVITGTPQLFPVMDDVFSPIIRQFKKIDIGPFEEEDDTESCVRRPLEKVGIHDASELIDFDTAMDIHEIHRVAGGRPYEIQLICHFMFRHLQEGRAKRMELTLEVLDSVLEELHAARDIWTRPVVASVRGLDRRSLSALDVLCGANGHATLDQLWFVEYVLWGDDEWTKDSLAEACANLEAMGVLCLHDGVISFAGDAFDRLYCRYFAERHDVPLSIPDYPFLYHLARSLSIYLEGFNIQAFRSIGIGPRAHVEIGEVAAAMFDPATTANAFASNPELALELYRCTLAVSDREQLDVATVTVTTPWTVVRRWFRCPPDDDDMADCAALQDLPFILAEACERALALDGRIEVQIATVPLGSVGDMSDQIEALDDIRIRQYLAWEHSRLMADCYLEGGDIEGAIFNARLAHRYDPEEWSHANNLGYVLLASDDLDEAQGALEMAELLCTDVMDKALPTYNLGVVHAKRGDTQRALRHFRMVIDQVADADPGHRQMSRLIIPVIIAEGRGTAFEELEDPDLLETAQEAAVALERILPP